MILLADPMFLFEALKCDYLEERYKQYTQGGVYVLGQETWETPR